MESILGISAFYHDSAAVLLADGEILAAAHEERFTRKKHDSSFPAQAIRYVLEESGLRLDDLAAVVFYDKPYLKFERLLETYHTFAPRGLKSFLSAIPVWVKEKLFMRELLRTELAHLDLGRPVRLLFPEHHLSHAASAFFPSPFQEAAILTVDGVGEWATTTIGHGRGNTITIRRQLNFPHSLGLLYSAFTNFCGFKVNSGEYKLMGLAPYGRRDEETERWMALIEQELVDIRSDGSLLLNMEYFNFATGLTMCCDEKWEELLGIPRRRPESGLSQRHMNLAFAIQKITEKVVLRLAATARDLTGCRHLVMAGGVALNCVANGELLRKNIFDDFWVQPAAGDAGGALGAAYAGWHIWKKKPRTILPGKDAMQGAYLGPEFTAAEIKRTANRFRAPFTEFSDFEALCAEASTLLLQGNVVGWFQGRMEYGPRALGNRSILADPRNPEMQKKLNLKIKYREGFRPFAPSVLAEEVGSYFALDRPSPYMLLVAPILEERRKPLSDDYGRLPMYDRLYQLRSDIPAITHVDFSARIQSVHQETNYRYWKLIETFRKKTGCGLVVNTSFNVRGEPIVCKPEDAYCCFMRTEMDYLVMGDFLFEKKSQPALADRGDWRTQYELD